SLTQPSVLCFHSFMLIARIVCLFLFFFSSRRRHTRCYRDWSSDVCSSDLVSKGDSSGACFLTEAQASAKDSVTVSTNTFAVTNWDEHTLTAVTEFYADKNGDQTSKSSPGAVKFVFRLVLDFETHQMTKFVEPSNGNTRGYHLVDQ